MIYVAIYCYTVSLIITKKQKGKKLATGGAEEILCRL